jgi:hypothetical protein
VALEVRYVPMKDEGDNNIPKLFRVIYQDDVAVSYSHANLSEVKAADPEAIAGYYDIVSQYFKDLATLVDSSTDFTQDLRQEFMATARLCLLYCQEMSVAQQQ